MHVVAIVAHPDDAAISCGGTLAKHAGHGDDVTVIHMTKGEYGGLGDRTEGELAEVRADEACQAGAILGADIEFLGFADGRVNDTLENRLRVVEAIRTHAPDILVTHFTDDMHPDHRATSRLVTDAYYMASLPLVDTEGELTDPDNVYYFGKQTSEFEPTTFVDITGFVDDKVAAIRQHESQVEFLEAHGGIDVRHDDLVEEIRARTRTLGSRVGATHAEGFRPLHETTREYLE